jgi:hypothetical protein
MSCATFRWDREKASWDRRYLSRERPPPPPSPRPRRVRHKSRPVPPKSRPGPPESRPGPASSRMLRLDTLSGLQLDSRPPRRESGLLREREGLKRVLMSE